MKKRQSALLVVIGFVLVVGALLFFYANIWHAPVPPEPTSTGSSSVTKIAKTSPSPSPALPANPDPSDQVVHQEKIESIFQTPISFWGKVIDEKGAPISGANVQFIAADKPLSDKGTNYSETSDMDGLFSVTGLKGAGLYVNVSKEGYNSTETSNRLFGYGIENSNKTPSPSSPAVFILERQTQTEPLKVFSSGSVRVSKNGQPVRLSLTRGRATAGSQDEVQIEVWTQDQQKDSQGRYPWRCQISVPNGGLVQRDNDKTFIAPESGYKMSDSVNMTPALEQWSPRIDREYYVKLSDGTFGLMRLGVRTGGAHYVVIDSFYNPSGSRNLEYDPTKTLPNR